MPKHISEIPLHVLMQTRKAYRAERWEQDPEVAQALRDDASYDQWQADRAARQLLSGRGQ